MESTICLLTEWTQKAGGHFKVDVLHLEREFGRAPKSIANAFVYVWRQTLVIKVVPCFLVGIAQFMVRVHMHVRF